MDWLRLWRKTYRTMAQTLAGVLVGTSLFWEVDWKVAVSTTVMSGLVCFLMGIADGDNKDSTEEIGASEEDPIDEEIIEH